MGTRAAWLRGGIAGLLAALVLGRWLVVTVVEGLWAESLGSADAYNQIRELQSWLLAVAFTAAAAWFLGNLYFSFRSIGSVSVPRRVGNIEILEALPRHYLLLGFIVVGLALALAVSHNAGSAWSTFALAGADQPGSVADPVLQRPIAYYLYELPWQRSLHRFVTVLAGFGLLVVGALYAAAGVIAWKNRRIEVSSIGRTHLATLSAVLALALFWGYRLEPMELVGGIHNVPLDTILVDVRLRVARGLSGLALLACGASIFWIWVPRILLVGLSWGALVVGSFVGHYLAPAFAGGTRAPEERGIADVTAAVPTLMAFAYGISVPQRWGEKGSQPDHHALAASPIWDSFALGAFLERGAPVGPHESFSDPNIQVVESPDGEVRPVYVIPRAIDLAAAADSRVELDWETVHRGRFSYSTGAVVVDGRRASRSGFPLFVPTLVEPDSVVEEVTDVTLERHDFYFGPNVNDYASVGVSQPVLGVAPGGVFRRLALAWVLQSPRILRRSMVGDSALLVWERDVTSRLQRYAPFLEFGDPYAVVGDGRLYWLSPGYISADVFPGVPAVDWRGEHVRYLHAGALGVVDAASGQTRVYALREPDLVMQGWIQLLPGLIESWETLPAPLARAVQYPISLFDIQREVVRSFTEPAVRGAEVDLEVPVHEPNWWLGPTHLDTTVSLHRVAVDEIGTPPVVRRILIGTTRAGALDFALVTVDSTEQMMGPSQLVRRFLQVRDAAADLHGALRVAPLAGGPVVMQSSYRAPTESGSTLELRGVTVASGGSLGSGATLAQAIERIGMEEPVQLPPGSWDEARRWFQRLDAARQSGDWRAFGEAYDALRRMFVTRDSVP